MVIFQVGSDGNAIPAVSSNLLPWLMDIDMELRHTDVKRKKSGSPHRKIGCELDAGRVEMVRCAEERAWIGFPRAVFRKCQFTLPSISMPTQPSVWQFARLNMSRS